MDEQIKELMKFLKPFRDNNKLTDDEFVKQLAEAILDHEDNDPSFSNTFEDFKDLMRKTWKRVDEILIERQMNSCP